MQSELTDNNGFENNGQRDEAHLSSQPLATDDTLIRRPTTLQLDERPIETIERRWGTIWADKSASLTVVVRGYEQTPLTVTVEDRLVIGRQGQSQATNIRLDLTDFDAYIKGVSRLHLAIVRNKDMLQVFDLHSTNGSYVNGRLLSPESAHILRDGDVLHLGQLIIEVHFADTR